MEIGKIRKWARDRNLDTADPKKQIEKLKEEVQELIDGIEENNMHEIVDGIGDVTVVLIVLSLQLNVSYENCVKFAYNEIKDRKGKMIDGVFVKEQDLKK